MSQNAYSRRPGPPAVSGRRARRQGAAERRAFAYGDAVRHSSRVRFLGRVLPSLAIVIVAVVGLIAWFDPLRIVREFPLELLKLSISNNKLIMDAPKLSGFTRDGRGYNITAQSAAQDLSKSTVIELTGINANFVLSSTGKTDLTATKGVYDTQKDIVHLTEGVVIVSSAGYEGRLNDAYIEVKKGHVISKTAIDILFKDGTLRADRMEVFDNGARAVFEGRVMMTMKLPPPKQEPDNTAAVSVPENAQ
jgi:lipopolysaccharide export system protein LptC